MKNPIGAAGEQAAAEYLTNKGYKILDRNWRIRGGEIDIVAVHDNCLVFVEVKTRSSQTFGTGEESVGFQKLAFLKRAALFYIQSLPGGMPAYRIDVVAVDINGGSRHTIRHNRSVTS